MSHKMQVQCLSILLESWENQREEEQTEVLKKQMPKTSEFGTSVWVLLFWKLTFLVKILSFTMNKWRKTRTFQKMIRVSFPYLRPLDLRSFPKFEFLGDTYRDVVVPKGEVKRYNRIRHQLKRPPVRAYMRFTDASKL